MTFLAGNIDSLWNYPHRSTTIFSVWPSHSPTLGIVLPLKEGAFSLREQEKKQI